MTRAQPCLRALAAVLALGALGPFGICARAQDLVPVGVGRADITPEGPIRLSGYGGRRTESEGVEQGLFAKAIAIGGAEPCVLVAVDSTGVPGAITEEVARRLETKAGVARERFVLTSTHTHTAPLIDGVLGTLFGEPVPEEHAERVRRYTERLPDLIESAALEALAARKPARLGWAQGWAGFAHNRRTAGGPVDRDVPVLVARGEGGKLCAVLLGYACHCTTLGGDDNRVCGDWAGYAQEEIERRHPGATALVVIGCGADADPAPRTGLEHARAHGAELAAELERLLGWEPRRLSAAPRGRIARVALDFAPHRARAEWEERAQRADAVGYHARVQLARLDAGEPLATALDYPIQTWAFGDELLMVFLPGEVVVDYSLRLKRELDAQRTWVVAYANDVPCYIPSRRILAEGGYEAAGAMTYYDRPGPLEPSVEERIVGEVRRQAPGDFTADASGLPSPLSPIAAGASLRAAPEYRVELVACEPQVVDPVAVDFSGDLRLFVVEMRDYPSGMRGSLEPGGRVRVLDDDDGDGFYERSSVFLDGLPFPTGLLCWEGGVLVCAAPRVLLARDTDGDDRADEVRTILDGFSTENYQARVNGLTVGLDGWIYGACGLLGGEVRSFRGDTLSGARDFRFDPESGALEAASGTTQQGRDRDDWGNWFGCDNSTLAWHYPLPDEWLRRNPYVEPPATRVSLAPHAGDSQLFPISRTLERYNDPLLAGRVTSACGLAVYRDELLGRDVRGDLFVCEPVHNLVTRRRPRPVGSTFEASRIPGEEASEFLRSTDPWFRPVQVRTGPHGGLWVVDMARAVIEHPRWIPESTLERLDVRSGEGLGRIWRVVPRSGRRVVPDVSRLVGEPLVRALDSPNGWLRDRATAALVRRGDVHVTQTLVRKLSWTSRPQTRLHALCALDGLGTLDEGALLVALADDHAGVRRHALRLCDGRLQESSERLREAVLELARDGDPQVRLQLAATLGSWDDARAGVALGSLLAGADAYLAGAIQSSAQPHLEELLEAERRTAPPDLELRGRLASIAIRCGREDLARDVLLASLPDRDEILREAHDGEPPLAELRADAQWAAELEHLGAVLTDLRDHGPPLSELRADAQWAAVFARVDLLAERARATVVDPDADLELRQRALALAAAPCAASTSEWLAALLSAALPPELQAIAARELGRRGEPATRALLERWPQASPPLRAEILRAAAREEAGALRFLEWLRGEPAWARALDPIQRASLVAHPSERVRDAAESALAGLVESDREAVLELYAGVSAAAGDARRGALLFEEHCGTCHRFAGTGEHMGPDLAALTDRSAEALLVAILDPSRAFLPAQETYAVETKNGVLWTGMVSEETAVSFVLTDAGRRSRTVLRRDVAEMRAMGVSMMPAGLEQSLDPAGMADLLAFLAAPGEPRKACEGNQPRVVTAERDGSLFLSAASAEIYGGDIRFEAPFQNIGYWHAEEDHVAWTVEVPAAGEWSVHLEWACPPETAGDAFTIEAGAAWLVAQVPATDGWPDYREAPFGALRLEEGRQRIVVRPVGDPAAALFDLRAVRLAR